MFITESDISKARAAYPVMGFGELGEIVDARTYRRWLEDLKRREDAYERNARVVNYNIGLASTFNPNLSNEFLRAEAEEMFEYMCRLMAMASGRAMWVGGTRTTELNPAGAFNCSSLAVNRMGAFSTLFELLMMGTGVGFRVFYNDIKQLPEIRQVPSVSHLDYKPVLKAFRLEDTDIRIIGNENDIHYHVTVGDSRQGWIDALSVLLNTATQSKPASISYDFGNVRPIGERIMGFGGTASGHEALKEMINNVWDIINELKQLGLSKLRSIDCMDICCAIAKGVVAGSSRRSALICLFDEGDDLCANAKKGLYTNPAMEHKKYRSQSNNTECIGSTNIETLRQFLEAFPDPADTQVEEWLDMVKPTEQWLTDRMESVRLEGEPGLANYWAMVIKAWKSVRKYRPEVVVHHIWRSYCDLGTNPCFAPGTLIVTKEGTFPIEDLVGKEVEVYDGNRWVTIDNFRVTGTNQPVYEVTLTNGESVKATPGHTFILEDGTRVKLMDLDEGYRLRKHSLCKNQSYEAKVASIKFAGIEKEVYCCTVPTNNSIALAAGIVTGQCFEILLSVGYADPKEPLKETGRGVGFCNLTTMPMDKFVENGALNYEMLEKALRRTVRIGCNQTCVDFPREELDATQREERLLGIDATGWQRCFALIGWTAYSPEVPELLIWMNKVANDEATEYSKVLGIKRPLRVTTCKPNGTASKVLGTTSDGIHYEWSPYYIRRIEIASRDALAMTLIEQGFPCIPTPGNLSKLEDAVFADCSDTWQREAVWRTLSSAKKKELLSLCNDLLFEFPVCSGAQRTSGDVSLEEQFTNVMNFTKYYVDHMVSSTITVKDDEWERVPGLILENWNSFINTSFFPYWSGGLPLMPYEQIEQERYEQLVQEFPEQYIGTDPQGRVTFQVDFDMLARIESALADEGIDIDEIDLSPGCATGACPIR